MGGTHKNTLVASKNPNNSEILLDAKLIMFSKLRDIS